MVSQIYTATKTRSGRPGWSVIFSHPRRTDARGRYGLKVRRGLGTQDDAEADRLVAQLNELLADQSWWSLDRRADAALRFDGIVVAAFYDGIEVGKVKSWERRESFIPLPTKDDGYARVMLVGSTGAGKTTLLRQLIGSDPRRDRFPSTSTAKTTIADIEIVTAPLPFKAAVTFMSEHETRCAIEECLEEACFSAVQEQADTTIANALLEHKEQRFRLSYILGAWREETSAKSSSDQYEMDYEYDDAAESETDALPESEAVAHDEAAGNKVRLDGYIVRIKKISQDAREKTTAEHGDFQEMSNANERESWREAFTDNLYQSRDFTQLSLDIMDAIEERFALIDSGDFERGATDWPVLWYYGDNDRDTFLRQVRWFSSNHDRQFGRLLTPLVDGVRVSGPFQPSEIRLQDDNRRLALLDGEGLGHSAKEANSISTKVTEKFPEADMILLVDNAQSPLQAAPLELIRSVGISGHGPKLAVAFTHFDQVKGDNLSGHRQKRDFVRASIGNAISSFRETLGAPVAEILDSQLHNNDFYLGGLDRPTDRIPSGFINDMRDLMDRMKDSAKPSEPIDLAPNYNIAGLAFALRDATDEFKNPWRGRLGLGYYEGFPKEHWTRVKALCRRIANLWANEYSDLRPVADLIDQLQGCISLWLDEPAGWTRKPEDERETAAAIDFIRQRVSNRVHALAERRLIDAHTPEWQIAFAFRGTGSTSERARVMDGIYAAAAPHISYRNTTPGTRDFLDEIEFIVREAVEEAGGSVT